MYVYKRKNFKTLGKKKILKKHKRMKMLKTKYARVYGITRINMKRVKLDRIVREIQTYSNNNAEFVRAQGNKR